jgi:hypothetical protein
MTEESCVDSRQGQEKYLSPKSADQLWGPRNMPLNGYRRVFVQGKGRHGLNFTLLSSADMKNEGISTSTSSMSTASELPWKLYCAVDPIYEFLIAVLITTSFLMGRS